MTEFQHLVNAVARLAADRRIPGPEYTAGPERPPLSGPTLSHGDMTILQEVVWNLIVDRVITPGADALNPQWPLLRMTERGRRAASKQPAHRCREVITSTPSAVADTFGLHHSRHAGGKHTPGNQWRGLMRSRYPRRPFLRYSKTAPSYLSVSGWASTP